MTDQELIQTIINGKDSAKRRAESSLFNNHNTQVKNYIKKVFNVNDCDAEALSILAFEKALNKMHTYKTSFKFRTWLISIAKNTAIDSFRGKKRIEPLYFSGFGDISGVSESIEFDPADEDSVDLMGFSVDMDNEYNKELVKKLFEHLPNERYKTIMILKYICQKTHKEVSEMLNIPMGTVQNIVNKAMHRLRAVSQDYKHLREDEI